MTPGKVYDFQLQKTDSITSFINYALAKMHKKPSTGQKQLLLSLFGNCNFSERGNWTITPVARLLAALLLPSMDLTKEPCIFHEICSHAWTKEHKHSQESVKVKSNCRVQWLKHMAVSLNNSPNNLQIDVKEQWQKLPYFT